MNRLSYTRQKKDGFNTITLTTSDLLSHLVLGFNTAVTVSQPYTSVTSNSIHANVSFKYSMNYSSNLWTDSINASTTFSVNTSKNDRSTYKTLFEDKIGKSNRDCPSRIGNESLSHFIDTTNV